MKSLLKLTGIGLRPEHYTDFLEQYPGVAWVEVCTEDYFADGGKALSTLEQIRAHYPVSFNGKGLSIGSSDELNWHYLKKLQDLCKRIDPCLVSDHLSWSSVDGQNLHQLLPLPYTEEVLQHVVTRIQQVQDFLKRQILIKNIANVIQYDHSTLSEAEFLADVAKRTGCSILLDVSNIYISATNLGFDPAAYLRDIPSKLVQEIHLGGFTTTTINEKEVLLDTHNRAIVPAVWNLYRETIKQLGTKATIIQWDSELPTLETLCLEAYRAEQIMRESYVAAKLTA